jgi:TPR repeat protein
MSCLSTLATGPKAPASHPQTTSPRPESAASAKSLLNRDNIMRIVLLFCFLTCISCVKRSNILEVSKDSINIPVLGGSETITISSGGNSWKVKDVAHWCKTAKNGDTLRLTCKASKVMRTGQITLTSSDKEKTIRITQGMLTAEQAAMALAIARAAIPGRNSDSSSTAKDSGGMARSAISSHSIDSLTVRANAGDASAQNDLGVNYMNGDGVAKDTATAAAWFRKSAEQGNAYGQCNYAGALLVGDGVKEDVLGAEVWFKKAAAQGQKNAIASLEKYATTFDAARSRIASRASVASLGGNGATDSAGQRRATSATSSSGPSYGVGEPPQENIPAPSGRSNFNMGDWSDYSPPPPPAPRFIHPQWTPAMKQYLSDLEMEGHRAVVERENGWKRIRETYANDDDGSAWDFDVAAASSRFPHYSYNVPGFPPVEDMGKGQKRNIVMERRQMRDKARAGDAEAQYNVGNYYKDGNLSARAYWLYKAARNGNGDAQYALAKMYAEGEYFKKNADAAISWYDKALAGGDRAAALQLAVLYYAKRDFVNTARHCQTAAANGYPDAQQMLAHLYSEGLGVRQSDEEAEKWLGRAADTRAQIDRNWAAMAQQNAMFQQQLQQNQRDFNRSMEQSSQGGRTSAQIDREADLKIKRMRAENAQRNNLETIRRPLGRDTYYVPEVFNSRNQTIRDYNEAARK